MFGNYGGFSSPFARRRPRPLASVMAEGGFGQARPAPHPAVQAATPPFVGDPGDPTIGKRGHGWTAPHIQRSLAQLGAANAFQSNPLLWQQIYGLQSQAMHDPTEDLAAMHGQEFERANTYYDQAGNRLAANLNARGLGDSSAMAQGLANVETGRAQGLAGLSSHLAQQGHLEQLSAQEQLRNLLSALQGQSIGQSSGIANALRQLQLQQQSIEGPSILEQLLGVGGQIAGSYLGGGFRR